MFMWTDCIIAGGHRRTGLFIPLEDPFQISKGVLFQALLVLLLPSLVATMKIPCSGFFFVCLLDSFWAEEKKVHCISRLLNFFISLLWGTLLEAFQTS